MASLLDDLSALGFTISLLQIKIIRLQLTLTGANNSTLTTPEFLLPVSAYRELNGFLITNESAFSFEDAPT
ncbi:hypothetical protein VTO73DRAFT_10034 [Trametes versicolor]